MITCQSLGSYVPHCITLGRVLPMKHQAYQIASALQESLGSCSLSPTWMLAAAYFVTSNLVYLRRRAHLRKTSMLDIFKVRITREEEFSQAMFLVILAAWQLLVLLYPLLELLASRVGYTLFFYSYPNAHGGGYILEPIHAQDLRSNQRTKVQFRLDWHRFKFNVGNVGRDGFRHPPALERNLPHIDFPPQGIKHWPWRRKFPLEKEKSE